MFRLCYDVRFINYAGRRTGRRLWGYVLMLPSFHSWAQLARRQHLNHIRHAAACAGLSSMGRGWAELAGRGLIALLQQQRPFTSASAGAGEPPGHKGFSIDLSGQFLRVLPLFSKDPP